MTSIDLLIRNGTVLTEDADGTRIPSGAVAVSGEKIQSLGPMENYDTMEANHQLDAHGGIIMPGLINTHTHLPMTIFRGLADDLPLDTWLNEHIFPAEQKYIQPDTVKHSTRLACAELLLSGTTTCCDGYFYEDAVAETVSQTGLRAVLAQGVIDFPAPGVTDPSLNIEHATSYIRKWQDRNPLIRPSIFCHSPYTCSPETLKKAKAAADFHKCLFQIHVAETETEWRQIHTEQQTTPVQYLDKLGLLNENTLLVHTIWVNQKDIDIIADRGSAISVTTESEMKLASGISPIPKFLKAKIPVGLGTDGCASNNDLDLFQEMDVTAKLHKVNSMDSSILDAGTVLKMATIEGAKAIGLDREIGSLEAGKQADIIILNTRHPRLIPLYNPISHIVYAMNGSDVRDVIVAGKILLQDRKLLTLELDDILAKGVKIGNEIKKGDG
jgi:5-methylthioadenosine/S-adenosylhomocysteine deaminase